MAKLNLVTFDGLPLPGAYYTYDNFKQACNYKFDADDVIIATYPKCGTTWTQYICWELTQNLDGTKQRPQVHEMWFDISPQLETFGSKRVEQQTLRPRLVKVHLPLNYLNYNFDTKLIHVLRNPYDACVSLFNNVKAAPRVFGFEDGTFEQFCDLYIRGQMPWGDYWSHAVSYLEEQRSLNENMLFLNFEEMKRDLRSEVLKVARFLDDQAYRTLLTDNAKLNRIVASCEFDSMKQLKFLAPSSSTDINHPEKHEQKFFFEGKINYGQEKFSPEHNQSMKLKIKSQLVDYPEVIDLWRRSGIKL